jgi:hypothetical protein
MRIAAIAVSGSSSSQARRDADAAAGISGTRALVAVDPPVRVAPGPVPHRRTPAALVAHLIATVEDHPQTRQRRRASPQDAQAAYRTAQALPLRFAGPGLKVTL